MKPLESAATPGVESVIRELIDDETLSSGSLSNKSRSTSVWAVGVTSRISSAPVTVMFVVAEPNTRFMFSVTGTVERTSTSWVKLAKPIAITVRW